MAADRQKATDEAAREAGQKNVNSSNNRPPVYQPVFQPPHNDYPELVPPPNGGMGVYPDDFGHQGVNAEG